jgi:hypothetical protein
MHRAGVVVQLGGQRQAHAFAFHEVLRVLVRQRLDGALLLAGVGRGRARAAVALLRALSVPGVARVLGEDGG